MLSPIYVLSGIALVVVVARGVLVGKPLIASSSSGCTLWLLIPGAKHPVVVVFPAAMTLNVADISCLYRYFAPSDPGLVFVPSRENAHFHILHDSLHLLQPECPVAVMAAPGVVVVVGET